MFYVLLLFQWNATIHDNKKNPPKFAIANGFVIGSMPKILQLTTTDGEKKTRAIAEHEITDLLKAIMAPVRPYGSIFLYTGEI